MNAISQFSTAADSIKIGVIADVQYANVDDVYNYSRTAIRRYRKSIKSLENGIDWWDQQGVDIVVDLGDAIDGYHNPDRKSGLFAINQVMAVWDKFQTSNPHIPVCHIVGNHELYKFTRDELTYGIPYTEVGSSAKLPVVFHCSSPSILADTCDKQNSLYYSFTLMKSKTIDSTTSPSWRFIVLDSYDQSVMRKGGGRIGLDLTIENKGLHKDFSEMCQKNNPNNILGIGGGDFFKNIQPGHVDSRWVTFNGGIGNEQIIWLEQTLALARERNEKIIIFSHVVIHPKATHNGDCRTLLWNYDEVLSIIGKYSVVRMVICGHAHYDAYHFCESSKVHHLTIASPLEAPDDQTEQTFCMLELLPNGNTANMIGSGFAKTRLNLELF